MKKTEIRKLVAEYKALKAKAKQKNLPKNYRISEKLKEIKHRYFHETGTNLENDL